MASLICLNFKNKFCDLQPIQVHNQREDLTDELIAQPDQSYLNYRLSSASPQPIDSSLDYEYEFNRIVKKLYRGKRAVRKDATVMCSLRVTSNKSFFEAQNETEVRRFFVCNYNFLKSYFGEDRVIDAVVHMDERIPHMHFCFVPITKDGRLCAKAIFDRKGLTLLHARALASIRESGFNITKSDDVLKPLKMAEDLKRSILLKEVQKLEDKLNEYKSIEIMVNSIDEIPFKRSKIPFRGDTVTLSDENFSKMRSIARFGMSSKNDFDKLTKENEHLRKRYDDHVLLINDLRSQIEDLTRNRDELLKEGMEMLSTIKSNKSLHDLYQHVKDSKKTKAK